MEANCFKLLTILSALCFCYMADRTLKNPIGPVSCQQHRSQCGPLAANPSEWLWARGKPCECGSNGFYCMTLPGCCSVGSSSAPGCLRLWLPCRLFTRPPGRWPPSESNQGGVNLLPLASQWWHFVSPPAAAGRFALRPQSKLGSSAQLFVFVLPKQTWKPAEKFSLGSRRLGVYAVRLSTCLDDAVLCMWSLLGWVPGCFFVHIIMNQHHIAAPAQINHKICREINSPSASEVNIYFSL